MNQLLPSNTIKTLFIFLFFNSCLASSHACDKNITGPISAPNNLINNGEVGCVTGDFSGSITVRYGGILRICGQYTFSGSINVSRGAKVVLTAGSSIGT